MNNPRIIVIAGPTASGKTSLAIKLAKEIDGEIINADSLQVYKENPILSAQPSIQERGEIPHHLFGYVNGDQEYNVARWINDAVREIKALNKTVILVGGTGFYIKHLIFGLSHVPDIDAEVRNQARELFDKVGAIEFHKLLGKIDPESAAKLEPNNGNRTIRAYEIMLSTGKTISYWQQQNVSYFPIESFKLVVLQPDREKLYKNCNQRFLDMLDNGALDEVKYLLKQNYNSSTGIMKSHGVPELSNYLLGEWSLDEAIEKSQKVVRNYAKRQTTWFKHQFNHPQLKSYFTSNQEGEFSKILDFIS